MKESVLQSVQEIRTKVTELIGDKEIIEVECGHDIDIPERPEVLLYRIPESPVWILGIIIITMDSDGDEYSYPFIELVPVMPDSEVWKEVESDRMSILDYFHQLRQVFLFAGDKLFTPNHEYSKNNANIDFTKSSISRLSPGSTEELSVITEYMRTHV